MVHNLLGYAEKDIILRLICILRPWGDQNRVEQDVLKVDQIGLGGSWINDSGASKSKWANCIALEICIKT